MRNYTTLYEKANKNMKFFLYRNTADYLSVSSLSEVHQTVVMPLSNRFFNSGFRPSSGKAAVFL